MGLNLEVGMVADLLVNDEEGAEHVQNEFSALSRYLVTINLQPHVDPPDVEAWSGDILESCARGVTLSSGRTAIKIGTR